MTHLRTWKPLIDEPNNLSFLLCKILYLLKEGIETEVTDFLSPKTLHTVHVQCLKANHVVLVSDLIGKFPMIVIALIGNLTMHTGKMTVCLDSVTASFLLAT